LETATRLQYAILKSTRVAYQNGHDIFWDYESREINSTIAAKRLGISKSTFLRRYREHKELP
jgi:transcriptional regulator of acetoin/glycerol metabolism